MPASLATRFCALMLCIGLATAAPAQRFTSIAVERPWLGLPQVEVVLNGRLTGRFIVDSGASRTTVSSRMVAALGLAGQGDVVRVNGTTGSASTRLIRLDSLALDRQVYRGLQAYAIPPVTQPTEFDGIVGADILRHHVAEFDLQRGRMALHSPYADFTQSEGRWHSIPARPRPDGVFIVTVRIGALELPALVDTGASQNIVNTAAARALGLEFVPDSASLTGVTGASGHVATMNQIALSGFSIGDIQVGRSLVGVVDLAVFQSLGLLGEPAMILGIETLSAQRFVLDYPRNRLLLERRTD